MLLFFSGVLFSDKWGGYGGGTREMFLLFNKAFISSRTWKAILGWEGILRPTQSVRTLEMGGNGHMHGCVYVDFV